MKRVITATLAIWLALPAAAQVASPQPVQPSRTQPSIAVPAPNVSNIVPLLTELESAAQIASLDTAKLRIDKWKADSEMKRQLQENVAAIQRNVTTALPGIIQQVRSDPQSVAASFKLYRNLNVLYDVFASVTESAGAFGPKNEFQMLASDANRLDKLRHTLADDLDSLAAYKDSELVRLRTQVAQAQTAPPPPKKVIDDSEIGHATKKKTVHKKKPAKPATTPAAAPEKKPQ